MSSALQSLLIRESAAIQAYVGLLDREALALGECEFASLTDLAGLKSEAAAQIIALEQERERMQLDLGYPLGGAGAETACAVGGPEMVKVWQDVLVCAVEAHTKNHRNGVMIHTQLDFTRKMLGFLQVSGQPLYGPDGSHRSGSGGGVSLAQG